MEKSGVDKKSRKKNKDDHTNNRSHEGLNGTILSETECHSNCDSFVSDESFEVHQRVAEMKEIN